MGSWIKLDADIITNAKVGQAGANGDRVYFVMLALHAKHGANGLIPASRCTPSGLRFEAAAILGRLSEKAVTKALQDCSAAGLIDLLDDGSVRLSGFDEKHMPECSRCHQPNPEPSHGTCPTCRAAKKEARQSAAAERQGETRRAEKGMPSSARAASGHANPVLSLPDRIGQEGIGQERIGEDGKMDGRMDGGVSLRSVNQNGEGVLPRSAGPSSAAAIMRGIAGGAP